MDNRAFVLSVLALGIGFFAAPTLVHAEKGDTSQGIVAPSAYLESIENPGDSGGVEDADAAAEAEAEQDANHNKTKGPKQD